PNLGLAGRDAERVEVPVVVANVVGSQVAAIVVGVPVGPIVTGVGVRRVEVIRVRPAGVRLDVGDAVHARRTVVPDEVRVPDPVVVPVPDRDTVACVVYEAASQDVIVVGVVHPHAHIVVVRPNVVEVPVFGVIEHDRVPTTGGVQVLHVDAARTALLSIARAEVVQPDRVVGRGHVRDRDLVGILGHDGGRRPASPAHGVASARQRRIAGRKTGDADQARLVDHDTDRFTRDGGRGDLDVVRVF